MSDLVVVACIQGAFAVIVLIVGARLTGKVNQVREQVQNGHSTNMREEQDERHGENQSKLDLLLEELAVLREHVKRLWSRSETHTQRIEEIDERTSPNTRSRFEPRRGRHEGHNKP